MVFLRQYAHYSGKIVSMGADADILEIYRDGRWVRAASMDARGEDGCSVSYLPDYIFSDNPQPLALGLPVGFETYGADDRRPDADETGLIGRAQGRPVTPFLYDLVPQGAGRKHLVQLLKLRDHDGLILPLLRAGAFNPIGRVRVRGAVDFFERHRALDEDGHAGKAAQGFTLQEIAARGEAFLNHLLMHAMLAAGTTGVQGVAPKFLLTQDEHGVWFADAALEDARARAHWLVKLPRGKTAADHVVHRHEAAYLRAAAALGLRVHAQPMMVGDMLFLRRFDRALDSGNQVCRLHQESLASLAGLHGFGPPTSHNELVGAVGRHVQEPAAEIAEYIKRDIFSLALRNTDNHARNSAVQVTRDGVVQLTPLYDVCPMFLDPEMVVRTVHWRDAGGRRIEQWEAVLDSLGLEDDCRQRVAQSVAEFQGRLATVETLASQVGIEPKVLEHCRASIDEQLRRLDALVRHVGQAPAQSDSTGPQIPRERGG